MEPPPYLIPGSDHAIFVAGDYEGKGPETTLSILRHVAGPARRAARRPAPPAPARSPLGPASRGSGPPGRPSCLLQFASACSPRHAWPPRARPELGVAPAAGSSGSRSTAESGARRRPELAAAKYTGFERLLVGAPRGLGAALGGGRRRHRRRPGPATRRPLHALPPDGLGRRRGRGGGRGTRPLRARLPRPRLLGQRRLRAPVPRRHASRRGSRDARVPGERACRPPSRRRDGSAGEVPAFRGSLPPRESTSRLPPRATVRAGSSGSAPGSSRSTSSPTSRGPPRATWTGRATTRSQRVRAVSSSSRRLATGPRASGSTATATGTSTV